MEQNAQDRNLEYLRMLEERNRLKKKASNREEEMLKEREKGFNTNWAGANAELEARNRDAAPRIARRSRGASSMSTRGERKKWSQRGPAAFVLGAQGPISLQPLEDEGQMEVEESRASDTTESRNTRNTIAEEEDGDLEEDSLGTENEQGRDYAEERDEVDEDYEDAEEDHNYYDDEFEVYDSNEEVDPSENIIEEELEASMLQMMKDSNRKDLCALRQSLAASVSSHQAPALGTQTDANRQRKKWGYPPSQGLLSSNSSKPKKSFWGLGVSSSSEPADGFRAERPQQDPFVADTGTPGQAIPPGRRKWGGPPENPVQLAAVRESIRDNSDSTLPLGQGRTQDNQKGSKSPLPTRVSEEVEPLPNELLHAVKALKPSQQAFLLSMLEEMERYQPQDRPSSSGFSNTSSEKEVMEVWERMREGLTVSGKNSVEKPPKQPEQEEDKKKKHGPTPQMPEPCEPVSVPLFSQQRRMISTPNALHKELEPTKALILRFHSSWGGSRTVGLAGVQLFDIDGLEEVLLRVDQLSLRAGLQYLPSTSPIVRDLSKLVDGVLNSGEDEHMWTGRLLEGSKCLELHIRLPCSVLEGGCTLKVHNYDKKKDSLNGLGVKEIDLFLDKLYMWNGVLTQGSSKGPLVLSIKGDKVKEQIFSVSRSQKRPKDFLAPSPSDSSLFPSQANPTGPVSWLAPTHSREGSDSGIGLPAKLPQKVKFLEEDPLDDIRPISASVPRAKQTSFSADELREDYIPPNRQRPQSGRRSRLASTPSSPREDDKEEGFSQFIKDAGHTGPIPKGQGTGLIVVAPATALLQDEEDILLPLERHLSTDRSKSSLHSYANSPSKTAWGAAGGEPHSTKGFSSSVKAGTAKDNALLESWDCLSTFGRSQRGRLGNTGSAILGNKSVLHNYVDNTSNNPAHPRAYRLTDSLKGERERRQQRVQQVMQQVQKIASEVGPAPAETDPSSYPGDEHRDSKSSVPVLPVSGMWKQQEEPTEYTQTPHPKTGLVEGSIPYVDEHGLMSNLLMSRNHPARVVEPLDSGPRRSEVLASDLPELVPPQLSASDSDSELNEAKLVSIPILPSGRVLQFHILSTWGDPFYVGLAGLEVFDETGQLVRINPSQIVAEPADVNILEGYGNDPRTVDKLVDGVPHTCDDLHVWLAPFEKGQDHTVTITFPQSITVSIIRIWNYNKSRAHSYRGVRLLRMSLDGLVIFKGEVRKAPGMLSGPDQCAEVVLFTIDEQIVEKLEEWDEKCGFTKEDKTLSEAMQLKLKMEAERPSTGDKQDPNFLQRRAQAPTPDETYEDHMRDLGASKNNSERPKTAAVRQPVYLASTLKSNSLDSINEAELDIEEDVTSSAVKYSQVGDADLRPARVITIHLLETWGDLNFFGLTGLNVLVGNPPVARPLVANDVTSVPSGLRDIGYEGDARTLDKILNNKNQTTEEGDMWLAPFTRGGTHYIRIELKGGDQVYGLQIWNYNKNEEDSLRGVKRISVEFDGSFIGQFLLRPGPGFAVFDFCQFIPLYHNAPSSSLPDLMDSSKKGSYTSPRVYQDYETQLLPSGLMMKVIVHTNWGDGYYVGLDGLQLFDHSGKEILIKPSQVHAIPSSLRDLGQEDARLPYNLFDGVLGTDDGCHSWLAPLAQTFNLIKNDTSLFPENVIYILFNEPICLSMVRIWNYRKTPARGAREFSLWIDGHLLYRGGLKKAPSVEDPYRGQAVLFTNDPVVIRREKDEIFYCGKEEQDLLCINDRQVLIRSKQIFTNPDPCAEGVVPDLTKRPDTAVLRQYS